MRKTTLLKTILLLCALIVGSGSVWGVEKEITFTPNVDKGSKAEGTTEDEMEKNGVTISSTKAVFARTDNYRTYDGSVNTFYYASGKITKIVITFTGDSYTKLTGTDFTISSTTGTWNGTASKYVTLTGNGASRISKIVVTVDDDGTIPSVMGVDFETTDLSTYIDWAFTSINIHSEGITAHGGSKWGATAGTASASIKTRGKVVTPGSFSCWISKESANTTASSWIVQVSSNGSDWTDVETADATSMSKGSWVEVTADLTDYSNVYVRLSYSGSTAVRAVDDIKLTMVKRFTIASACTDGEKYYGTFSCNNAFVVPEGITVSALKIVDGKLSYMDYAKDDVVPASTGVLVSSTTSGQKTVYLSDGAGAEKVGNMLKPSGDAGIAAASMNIADTKFYRLTMHNGSTIGFWWGAESGEAFDLGANKAYLAVPETAAREGFSFENDVTGIKNLSRALSQGEGVAYNLAGQRVNASHKGLVIVNGKKYLNK